MPIVNSAEAAQIIASDYERLGRGIAPHLPPTHALIRKLTTDPVFSICNVGPWHYRIDRACSTVFIPAYDPKQDNEKRGYAASTPFAAIHREAKGTMEPNEYTFIEDDGRVRAMDFIGVGPGMDQRQSLLQYGVFIPAGHEPTKEELHEATRQLDLYADRLIMEARDAFDKGREEWGKVRTERHIWAGRRRGVQEKWVTDEHTEQSVRCESCGRFNPSSVAKCQCGEILDWELYKRLEARKRERLEEMELEEKTRPKK